MKRILIHMNIEESGEYDIFNQTDIEKLKKTIAKKENKQCPNFGNRLWFQALISEIQNENNILEYYEYFMTKDYINHNYDLIIAPMANIFSVQFAPILEELTEKFENITIPVYVIACGVQANSYDDLDELCRVLKKSASKFIRCVYNTGGEFALRGYFTKEFFDRLGFHSAVVTGCPSLYQMGQNLKIEKKQLKENEMKVIFNGIVSDYYYVMKKYPTAQFFAQHEFFQELYDRNYFDNDYKLLLKKMIKIYGSAGVKLLAEDKIKLIPDMNIWREYLIKEKFNFSFGKRIHGTIMPILAGIPAVIEVCDSRTKEMAEFFDIPHINVGENTKFKSLHDIYEWMDYSRFNKNYNERYETYQKFLRKCGIVKKINANNLFFHDLNEVKIESENINELSRLAQKMQKEYVYWYIFERIIHLNRKLRNWEK